MIVRSDRQDEKSLWINIVNKSLNINIWVSFSQEATLLKPSKLAAGVNLDFSLRHGIYTGAIYAIHDGGEETRTLEVVEL